MIDTKRFLIIAICLIIIFLTIMTFFWFKTEEITNSPCAVCAKRLGDTVTCGSSLYSNIILYHPNLSIEEQYQEDYRIKLEVP